MFERISNLSLPVSFFILNKIDSSRLQQKNRNGLSSDECSFFTEESYMSYVYAQKLVLVTVNECYFLKMNSYVSIRKQDLSQTSQQARLFITLCSPSL